MGPYQARVQWVEQLLSLCGCQPPLQGLPVGFVTPMGRTKSDLGALAVKEIFSTRDTLSDTSQIDPINYNYTLYQYVRPLLSLKEGNLCPQNTVLKKAVLSPPPLQQPIHPEHFTLN